MTKCFLEDHDFADLMQQVQRNINEYGVHLTGVGAIPSFTYTTGMYQKFGYELLVYGLPPHYAAQILNDIYQAALHDPLKMDVPDDRFTNLPVVFKKCSDEVQEINGVSSRFYGKKKIPMVQVVMCDKAGKFPWEQGFDHEYMDVRQLRYWE